MIRILYSNPTFNYENNYSAVAELFCTTSFVLSSVLIVMQALYQKSILNIDKNFVK